MNRFSVIYQYKEQYHHVGRHTLDEARATLEIIANSGTRRAIGIYDDKTELFSWEPNRQGQYDQSPIETQGRLGEQIIHIAQALRRRDINWRGEFQRPSLFA
jgi:hypothetical protein